MIVNQIFINADNLLFYKFPSLLFFFLSVYANSLVNLPDVRTIIFISTIFHFFFLLVCYFCKLLIFCFHLVYWCALYSYQSFSYVYLLVYLIFSLFSFFIIILLNTFIFHVSICRPIICIYAVHVNVDRTTDLCILTFCIFPNVFIMPYCVCIRYPDILLASCLVLWCLWSDIPQLVTNVHRSTHHLFNWYPLLHYI